jgi:hypothetical protein
MSEVAYDLPMRWSRLRRAAERKPPSPAGKARESVDFAEVEEWRFAGWLTGLPGGRRKPRREPRPPG